MPEKKTLKRAAKDKRQGKAPSTQAGEFVREEVHHIREGKHGARSTKQAIAIGLAKARRAGVDLPAPDGKASARTKRNAAYAARAGKHPRRRVSPKRSRAMLKALRREGHAAVSKRALSRQAHSSAVKRGPADRSAAAKKAVRTKGHAKLAAAARKAAKTRARRRKGR
jgi:hypothetical protein